eukprot:g30707.t1
MKGLQVVVELQPQLFLDSAAGCFVTGFDCYERIKVAYRQMLSASGIWSDGKYHPAVQALLLARDPVALAATLGFGSSAALLGIVSAWDGVLGAERAENFCYFSCWASGCGSMFVTACWT